MVLSESVETFIKLTCIHTSSLLLDTTTCGTTKNECNQMTSRLPSSTSTSSPPSDTGFSIGPAIIGFVFIFIILAFLCYCLLFCVRKVIADQSRNTRTYTPPIPQSQYLRQQQFVQQPGHLQPRVPSVNRSAHTNAATPIYYNNEQLPPSYESVIRDTRFMYPAPSAPMRDVPLQESNFRL